MENRTESLPGLRPTPRQLLIFASFGLILLGTLVSLIVPKNGNRSHLVPWVLVFSPWLLGLLFMLLDRPGPVRNWLAPLLLSLFYPCLALWHDALAIKDWTAHHKPPSWASTILFNGVIMGSFLYYLARIYPRRCPDCSARGLIPLQRVLRDDPRTAKTRWCASCGKKYWSDPQGQWRVERRKTWLDAEEAEEQVDLDPAGSTFRDFLSRKWKRPLSAHSGQPMARPAQSAGARRNPPAHSAESQASA